MVSKFKLDTKKSEATKAAITRSFEIADTYAGELVIEVLPLDKIELDPENKRDLILTLEDAMHGIDKSDPDYTQKKADLDSLQSLAKTIRDDQLINPIYVYRFGTKCRLIAGERRTLASAIAGKKEIIARIASRKPAGTKLRILQWIENNERSDLSIRERLASIEAILVEYGKEKSAKKQITGEELSHLTGMSVRQSRRYLVIFKASSEIRAAIDQGRLENLKLIEYLSGIKNAVQQKRALEAAIRGSTFDEVVKIVQLARASKNKPPTSRKKISIKVGTVKPSIAKILINSIKANSEISHNTKNKINTISKEIEWGEIESAEIAFKQVMALLEKEAIAVNEPAHIE